MSSLNYKGVQKASTELNADGNDERGRYGEDESPAIAPFHHSTKVTEEQWVEILKALHDK
jgi:hypothetical protein